MKENISEFSSSQNNRRIAKNTLMLYFRMILIMVVSLYTSRVVLNTLGVSDYGIYNVVGGFVTMLAYLNSVFMDATLRFISFALGENNLQKLKKVFCTSLTIHIGLAIIIFIIAETFGIWFVNVKLNINPERMIAANWVYQCSIITLLVTIINIPYRSCIVAHEHMHIYAYFSIIEVVLKLLIVFLLFVIPADKLIVYSILYLIVSVVIPLCYTIYCKKKFEECTFSIGFDKPMLKEMFSYAKWVMVGNLGFSFKDQFSNVMLNMFLGTLINAARGITMQVNGIVSSFANNFLMALSPQITKQYATGNIEQSKNLVYAGSRGSFYLMTLITIPIIINVDYILKLWLGVVPEYTAEFLIITLIASLFYAVSRPLTIALQATGDIKIFQIGISIIMLLELPVAYILLKHRYPPHYALMPAILTNLIGIFYRLFLIKKMIPSYNLRYFIFDILLRCSVIFVSSFGICFFINTFFEINFLNLIINVIITILIICGFVYFAGISSKERTFVNNFIKNRLVTIRK